MDPVLSARIDFDRYHPVYPSAEQYVPTPRFSHEACLLHPRLSFPPEEDLPVDASGVRRQHVWRAVPGTQHGDATPAPATTPASPQRLHHGMPAAFKTPAQQQLRFARLGVHAERARRVKGTPPPSRHSAATEGSVALESTSHETLTYVYKEYLKMHTQGLRDYGSAASATEALLERVRALVLPVSDADADAGPTEGTEGEPASPDARHDAGVPRGASGAGVSLEETDAERLETPTATPTPPAGDSRGATPRPGTGGGGGGWVSGRESPAVSDAGGRPQGVPASGGRVGRKGQGGVAQQSEQGASPPSPPSPPRGADTATAGASKAPPPRDARLPHPLLTATAAALFLRIANSLTSYKGVVQKLLTVLLQSIYTDYDPSHTEADLIGLTLYSASAKESAEEADEYLKRVKILTVSQRTCGRVLTQTVGKWQELSLRCIVRSWRALVLKERVKAVATASSVQHGCQRKQRIMSFYKWKAYASKCIQRKFVEVSAGNTASLTQWLDDVRAQLRAREGDVTRLKEFRTSQRKKNEALFELLSAEQATTSSLRGSLRLMEGRLLNTAELPLSTFKELDRGLSDYDRPPVDIFLHAGCLMTLRPGGAQHGGGGAAPQGNSAALQAANSEDVLAYHVDDLEAFLCMFFNKAFPSMKTLSALNFFPEIRSMKHALALAMLITDTTHINPERLSEGDRMKWLILLYSEVGGGRGMSPHAFSNMSDVSWLGVLCVMVQRYSMYNPRKLKTVSMAEVAPPVGVVSRESIRGNPRNSRASVVSLASGAAGQQQQQQQAGQSNPPPQDELFGTTSFQFGKPQLAQHLMPQKGDQIPRGEVDIRHVAEKRAELLARVIERKRWQGVGAAVGNMGATLLNQQAAEQRDGSRIRIKEPEFRSSLAALGYVHAPATGAELVSTAKQFVLIANTEFPLLYRVYLYYRLGTLAFRMEEWRALCGDAKLVVKPATVEGCEAIFLHVAGQDPSCDGALSFRLFMKCVFLLAFYANQTDKLTQKTKLLSLLGKIAQCPQADVMTLNTVVQDERVCDVLKSYKETLKKVFLRYTPAGPKGSMTMSAAENLLAAMVLPQSLRDMPVPVLLNTVLFSSLQPQQTESELAPAPFTYKVFTHLVVVVALSVCINPLHPPYQRIAQYLQSHFSSL